MELVWRRAQIWPKGHQQKCWYEHEFPRGLLSKLSWEQQAGTVLWTWPLSKFNRAGRAGDVETWLLAFP